MSKLTGTAAGAGGNAGAVPVKRAADQMMNNGNSPNNKTPTKRTADSNMNGKGGQQAAKRADTGSGKFRLNHPQGRSQNSVIYRQTITNEE